ncbi:MAG: tRNA 2-thiouridine(34) synthase MnmA [Candidatus Saccharimonadales bacterium]
MAKRVYVGLSGGVDSSLTAALLKEQGYDVSGVYMKNWTQDIPGFVCPWLDDYQDAKRVAVKLKIPFKLYDFEKQYRKKVVDYLIEGYKSGITPNPDVICNQEIKFKLFLETALEDGADFIATGHYARIIDGCLKKAIDTAKDQTYFLYRVNQAALTKSLMPIGDMLKTKVRAEAKKRGLPTAAKKDSQGICFIGKVGIKEFLLNELGPQKPGPIINQKDKIIGTHDGAIFYTIGQRHGLNVGGGLPYYVTGKNIKNNQVFVTTDLDDKGLWSNQLTLANFHWTCPGFNIHKAKLQAVTRYHSKPINCKLSVSGLKAMVRLDEAVRAVTPGQSAVIYSNNLCVGGGIII